VIAAVGVTLLAGLVVGFGSVGDLVRATSALFIGVYLLAIVSAIRILDGRVRLAAVTALIAVAALAVFSAGFLVVPLAAGLVALALRRALRA
jgi:amino acid efflux transporter